MCVCVVLSRMSSFVAERPGDARRSREFHVRRALGWATYRYYDRRHRRKLTQRQCGCLLVAVLVVLVVLVVVVGEYQVEISHIRTRSSIGRSIDRSLIKRCRAFTSAATERLFRLARKYPRSVHASRAAWAHHLDMFPDPWEVLYLEETGRARLINPTQLVRLDDKGRPLPHIRPEHWV